MSSLWSLTLESAAQDRSGTPQKRKTYEVYPGTEVHDIVVTAAPVFSPGVAVEALDTRSALDRDACVPLRVVLKSLLENKPVPACDPDYTLRTARLTVFAAVVTTSVAATNSVSVTSSYRRGRDQASHKGKISALGQNNDSLLTTDASLKMRNASKLLLEREPAHGHKYCQCAKQNPVLKDVITSLTALTSMHNSTNTAEKALARQVTSVVEVLWSCKHGCWRLHVLCAVTLAARDLQLASCCLTVLRVMVLLLMTQQRQMVTPQQQQMVYMQSRCQQPCRKPKSNSRLGKKLSQMLSLLLSLPCSCCLPDVSCCWLAGSMLASHPEI